MSERIEPMFPTRKEVEFKIIDILDGRVERSAASDWARSILVNFPAGGDPGTVEALERLARVDEMESEYLDPLCEMETVRGWLESLRAAPPEFFPLRFEIERKLRELLSGQTSREDAAAWARKLMERTDDVRVTDFAAWDALKTLCLSDGQQPGGSYMYGKASFRAWLEELCASPLPKAPENEA